jgi:hypothetical protein
MTIFRLCASSHARATFVTTPPLQPNGRIPKHIRPPFFYFRFGPPLAFHCPEGGTTFKITINEDEANETVTLRLEGRIARPWFTEFRKAWDGLAASLGSRKLMVDLCGVTQMCSDARELLAGIYARTSAQFLADTPLTKYFAEEARKSGLAQKRGMGTKEKGS